MITCGAAPPCSPAHMQAVTKACGADLLSWEVSFNPEGAIVVRDGYKTIDGFKASAAATVRTSPGRHVCHAKPVSSSVTP